MYAQICIYACIHTVMPVYIYINVCVSVCMYVCTIIYMGGARGVMVIVAGYGHGDTSSNPRPD